MLTEYDFDLPEEYIAKHPTAERTQSRLMHVSRNHQTLHHHTFNQLPELLKPNDLVVFNNTKVVKARLQGQKISGGRIELFVEHVDTDQIACVMIKASKAPKINSNILIGTHTTATILSKQDRLYQVKLLRNTDNWWAIMEEQGSVPLPPYMKRQATPADERRYQSVFAKHPGAVAAPTASLHFDEPLLDQLVANQVSLGYLTLHVGAGTFLPLQAEQIQTQTLHTEHFSIPETLKQQIQHCREKNGRIIAVGTTVVRALESAYCSQTGIKTGPQQTQIFIQPGFKFQFTDAMITNFHLPKSSLLMLVSSFSGHELMHQAYQSAIDQRYRFYSYGDAMMIS